MSGNGAEIIDALVARRKDCGMTQKELAEAASLTQSVVARMEGKKVSPGLETLMRVAEALQCCIKVVPMEK